MSRIRITSHAASITLIAITSFHAALSAQVEPTNRKRPLDATPTELTSRAALADAMREKAEPFLTKRSTWVEGARVLKQAAELRHPSDPAYVWDMFDAARTYLNAKKLPESLEAMAETGSRGIEVGDTRKGAHAYLNAAVLARRIGKEEEAMGYVRTALELAWHRKTMDSERDEILARIKEGGRKVLGEPDWIP